MRSDRGYSLIEMLIVLGLLGIVTGISVPVFLESNARSRLWTGSEEIGAAIRQARLRAISTNANYRLVFNCPAAGAIRSLIMTGVPAEDDAPDRCSQTVDGDSGTHTMPPGVAFDTDGATYLSISGRGAFSVEPVDVGIPLTISVTHGSTVRTLTVSTTGQITFSNVE